LVVVTYHDDLNGVQGDPVLAALLRAPIARAPFDRIEWWQGLERHCGLAPLIVVASEGDQRAVLPLMRRARSAEMLGNWYNFTAKPLFTSGAEPLLTPLFRDLAGQMQRLALAPLPDEDGSASLCETALRRAGWSTFREVCDTNHLLELRGRCFAEYLAARPGPLRTTLKRKSGKVDVVLARHFDPALWAGYEAVYAASWKPEEGSPAFLRAFAEAEGAAGRLRLALAFAENQPVAAQFWTVEADTAFIHKLAHRADSTVLSPGTTLSAALFEQVIDRDRVERIDFGTGNDSYKADWMEQIRPRWRIAAFRPEWPGNWPAIARKILKSRVRRG